MTEDKEPTVSVTFRIPVSMAAALAQLTSEADNPAAPTKTKILAFGLRLALQHFAKKEKSK